MSDTAYARIYKVLAETHRSDQDDHSPVIEDHYDRVNLAQAIIRALPELSKEL